MIAVKDLRTIAGARARTGILEGVAEGLARHGKAFGLDRPEMLAAFLAQIGHESGRFRHLEEIWGPTAAQRRYDSRADLGNTPETDGDGYRYRGRGLIHVTGRANVAAFAAWAKERFADAPDFLAEPNRLAAFPWAFVSALWYWESRDLGRLAAVGDLIGLTRAINGGLNGLADRRRLYVRTALVLLGQELTKGAVKRFQAARGLTPDDIAGAKTLHELHAALSELPALKAGAAMRPAPQAGRAGPPWGLIFLTLCVLAALAAAIFLSGGKIS
ncbi:glycoside hydrolase family 19 protein [Afifella sp. YEN Y35]|uniref:glycoside hydrolase family 19 protein n=1 Tax=Afifella sp. YEN Y35 TaxID=3388337 RepID=UPI0039DF9DE1